MNYRDLLSPTLDLHVSKIEEATLSEVSTVSVNTWCVSSEISKGLGALIEGMLENSDYFENCLIIGKCYDKGQEVNLEAMLETHAHLDFVAHSTEKSNDESRVVDIFLGDNLTVCLAPNMESIEDISLYDTVVVLDIENSFAEIEESIQRMQTQANYLEEIVDQLGSGLFIAISNCVTGILAGVASRVDTVTTVDVEDLGLPFPDNTDAITLRDAFNSVPMPVQNPFEDQYKQQVAEIFENKRMTANRTSIGTMKEFGGYMHYDLRKGFPLPTTKYVDVFNVARELRFFNRGMTNEHDLSEMGCNVWKDWAADDGELGPVYGKMWRDWEDTRLVPDNQTEVIAYLESRHYEYKGMIQGTNTLVYVRKIDQLSDAINTLIADPNDRRLVVSAFNPGYSPSNTRAATPNERLQVLIDDEVSDTAGNYADEFEDEGHSSSEEMAQAIVDEKYGEYENLTHEKLDELGASRFDVAMSPKENAEVGQQALPPCHMLFQLGSVPMSLDERIAEFARRNIGEDRFATNPVTCSNYNAIMTREHNNLITAVERDLGEGCTEEELGNWLTDHGIPLYYLDLSFYQRSADMFRGIPYNAASYSLQLMVIAKRVGMVPRRVHHYLGDKHVYENHFENIAIQMERVPYAMPVVEIADFGEVSDFSEDHINLKFYKHHGKLSAGKMAV